ncbi:50S ribosomal protein L19 [Salibacteraceae bacterium]|nr:50S ribosomal protein L19 [Salibacteraceae bacterium]MDA9267290.1 50S ribosomal protein L19 [Salibacteraceae bacterium]MDB9709747.1 50S ribosomal protein L19 [Salibacteraceae bacterium]
MQDIINEVNPKNELTRFDAGDSVAVHYKIKEGAKERIQVFQGVVIQKRGKGSTETFTVRKMSNSVGVERIFPSNSPFIDKIEMIKRGKVRRSRIFYLRDRKGKAARIKERYNRK